MIFIHHHNDTEREERPPDKVRRIGRRLCDNGGPALSADMRAFVSATDPQLSQVRSTPSECGADYWEIVIEGADL